MRRSARHHRVRPTEEYPTVSFASKLCLVVVLISGFVPQSHADILAQHVITQRVIRAATAYAQSVACDTWPIHAKDVVSLVPYVRDDPWESARYAVLWPPVPI